MEKLLSRGAFPQAATHLLEAVRAYEKAPRSDRDERYYYSRSRADFSATAALQEYYDDPLKLHCLDRRNWAALRPELYVSIYITERENLVIEVRPCASTGFSYSGMRLMQEEGDFRQFFIYTPPFSRPSNRVFYLPLGRVYRGLGNFNAPWDTRGDSPRQFARERHLCVLAVQAKLHQLSLYFDCHVDRELVEFGEHHFVDFRRLSPGGRSVDTTPSMPNSWAPARIREFLSTSDLSVEELYAFARDYLGTVPPAKRVEVYAQYLADSHSSRITDADVTELLRLATNENVRKKGSLDEFATWPGFTARLKHSRWEFEHFCREFSLTTEDGLDWVLAHHPEGLECLQISSAYLVKNLRKSSLREKGQLLQMLDKILSKTMTNGPHEWITLSGLQRYLEDTATPEGFTSFDAFQKWARKAAPQTWEASLKLAERVSARIQACQAEVQAKKQAATAKRKAARAASKQANSGDRA